jgi:hypothetical protein
MGVLTTPLVSSRTYVAQMACMQVAGKGVEFARVGENGIRLRLDTVNASRCGVLGDYRRADNL